MMRRFVAVLCLATAIGARGEALVFESSNEQVQLLELYTSEGCSSCPPADQWMSRLKSDPRLWKQVVPVAFHVDYWDYIGWKDRFALPVSAERQRRYARQGDVRAVYTPGFVLQGSEWRDWYRAGKLDLSSQAVGGLLRVGVDGREANATFRLANMPATLELHVAILGFGITTPVAAGENRGRELNHDFVVLAYGQTTMQLDNEMLRAAFQLPGMQIEAPRTALAAWVSERNNPRPLQSVGGWLE